jgi:hypothetical protein
MVCGAGDHQAAKGSGDKAHQQKKHVTFAKCVPKPVYIVSHGVTSLFLDIVPSLMTKVNLFSDGRQEKSGQKKTAISVPSLDFFQEKM